MTIIRISVPSLLSVSAEELNLQNIDQIILLSKMIHIIRTDSDNKDFIELVRHLDADLAEKDGDDHSFYAQFNKIDKIKYAVVAYENEKPLGCGAIKEFGPGTME